jgi:hypothetical protein
MPSSFWPSKHVSVQVCDSLAGGSFSGPLGVSCFSGGKYS